MKKLFKNPLFYLSVVLVIAVGFTVFSFVRAADTFKEPTKPFPLSDVEAPIDESSADQTKKGSLTIENDFVVEEKITGRGSVEVEKSLTVWNAVIPGRICLYNSVTDSVRTCKSYWDQFGGGVEPSGLEVKRFGDTVYGSRTSGPSGDNLGEWDFCAIGQVLTTEQPDRRELRGCQLTESRSGWMLSTIGKGSRCAAYCFNLNSDEEERSGSRR